MNIRTVVMNALLAGVYIALTAFVLPISFYQLQFRISEILNHLVVFDKRFFFGIAIGVFLTNLFFSPLGAYEFIFGLSHTILSLGITIFLGRYIKNKLVLMGINSVVFSFNMFLIAYMLKLAGEMGDQVFAGLWLFLASEELAVMVIGMFIMYAIHKRINLSKVLPS